MVTPLYEGHDEPRIPQKNPTSHKGLWFERFFNKYIENWTLKTDEDSPEKKWIDTLVGSCGDEKTLHSHAISVGQLCDNLAGKSQVFKNNWHFVTGMGNNHPVENGMSWHPTLGTPYLTGASVKGLLRSWMEEWSDLKEDELKQKLFHWFGSDHKDPKEQQKEAQAGALIFFDAVPVSEVKLCCDIMTPHMGKWYSDGGKINKRSYSEALPADWHNPIPIPFLAVKQASLQFCIAPRAHAKVSQEECQEAMKMLKEALKYLGAGAKTAAGYGRFEIDSDTTSKLEKIRKKALRTNMTPEDRFVDELKDKDGKEIAVMFGKEFNKTKKEYEQNNCSWDKIIDILLTENKAMIMAWKNKDKNTAEGKAYKKLKPYLGLNEED